MVIERQNHLARLVSSFENRVREWRAATDDEFAGRARPRVARRAAAFFADPLRTIEWEAATLKAGVDAMRANGMTVLELDFDEDVIAHPCGAVARAWAAAAPARRRRPASRNTATARRRGGTRTSPAASGPPRPPPSRRRCGRRPTPGCSTSTRARGRAGSRGRRPWRTRPARARVPRRARGLRARRRRHVTTARPARAAPSGAVRGRACL